MRWLGMAAAVLTLAAVVLNTLWFGRHGHISVTELLSLSGLTLGYLLLFLLGVFAMAWLSARVLARLDPREHPQDEGADEEGEGGGKQDMESG